MTSIHVDFFKYKLFIVTSSLLFGEGNGHTGSQLPTCLR